MFRRQRCEKGELDAIGAFIGSGVFIDFNRYTRDSFGYSFGKVADLIVPGIRSGINYQELAAL